jgi:hypothetical protein
VALTVGPLAFERTIEKAKRAVIAEAALGQVLGSLTAGGNEPFFGTPIVHGFGEILEGRERELRAEFEA